MSSVICSADGRVNDENVRCGVKRTGGVTLKLEMGLIFDGKKRCLGFTKIRRVQVRRK